MKKILLALLIVFMSFFSINVAYADMSAPETREFEIVVTNPNGVDYYDYNGNVEGHLNNGDKVLVIYEYNGEYTLGVRTTKYGFESYESLGRVKSLDGFEILQEEVDPTQEVGDKKITKYETARKAVVYANDGVDVYKGPSTAYDKAGHIKKDTLLTYNYGVESFGLTYIYVSTNEVKGWVEILGGKVLVENNTQYIFREDVDTKCGIIPKNSITTPTYKTDQWKHQTLFEYNNCKVLLDTFRDENILDIYGYTKKVTKDVTLYKEANSSSEVIGTIPSGTEITVLAGGDFMAGTENVRYIQYGEITGWALDGDSAFEYVVTEEEKTPEIEDTIKIEEEKTPDPQIDVEKKPETKPIFGIGLNLLIILCACGVGLLVITAVVVIILVNKLGKKKEE